MIKIVHENTARRSITTDQMLDGRAYVLTNDNKTQPSIFICNRMGNIAAFSVCGVAVVHNSSAETFYEVDLEVHLKGYTA